MIVAQTIIDQMGGTNRLIAMIGAKYFVSGDNTVMFAFSGCRKASKVRIKLNSMDLYDITFFKKSKLDFVAVQTFEGIYNDQLKKTFENYTGLYLF
jgi:hypothetical protein